MITPSNFSSISEYYSLKNILMQYLLKELCCVILVMQCDTMTSFLSDALLSLIERVRRKRPRVEINVCPCLAGCHLQFSNKCNKFLSEIETIFFFYYYFDIHRIVYFSMKGLLRCSSQIIVIACIHIWPWNPAVFIDVAVNGSSFKRAGAFLHESKTVNCGDN